jgi:hypothetical protein
MGITSKWAKLQGQFYFYMCLHLHIELFLFIQYMPRGMAPIGH